MTDPTIQHITAEARLFHFSTQDEIEKKPANRTVDIAATWDDFVAFVKQPRTATKKTAVPGWFPTTFSEGIRNNQNAQAISMLVVDVDNKADKYVTVDMATRHLDDLGLCYLIYTSWTHSQERPKYRVVVPLCSPVNLPPKLHKDRWYPAAMAAIQWPDEWMPAIDKACGGKARVWFLPAQHGDSVPEYREGSGDSLFVPEPQPEAKKPRVKRVKASTLQAPGRGDFSTLDVVAWLSSAGLYRKPIDSCKHAVECPWAAEHTSKGTSDTVVWEATGDKWPTFHCSHEHCANRTIREVIEHVGDADRFCAQEFTPRDKAADDVASQVVNTSTAFVPNPKEEDAFGLPTTPREACRRYVQIVGMDSIYDRKTNGLIRTSEFIRVMNNRIIIPSDDKFIPWRFTDAPNRATITTKQLMFAPGQQVEPPAINTFEGLPLADKPRLLSPSSHTSVKMIVELFMALAGGDKVVAEWMLSWVAWPIQHLGDKLRSCVVCRGPQGTGKSMCLSLLPRTLYGEYATVIGQQELESSFNSWASRKLYIVGEEVASRAGVRDTSGRLKALVTEPSILINQKHMVERCEDNHANFAFLSNDAIPLWLDEDDRRAFVVDVPATAKKEPEFYNDLVREFRRQPEAWFQFLRDEWRCPADFPDRPVPMTTGKAALLERCRPAATAFVQDWLAGDAEAADGKTIPVLCCRGSDIFAVFRSWCGRQGYRDVPKRLTLSAALRDAGAFETRELNIRYWVPPGRESKICEIDTFRDTMQRWDQ